MSIATVVTMGYGSFGSVNLIPTLGFGVGEEVAAAGHHCGAVTLRSAYNARVGTHPAYTANISLQPAYKAHAEIHECRTR